MGRLYLGNDSLLGIKILNGPVNTADATIKPEDVFDGKIGYGTTGKFTGTLKIPPEKIVEGEVIKDIVGTRRLIDFVESMEGEIPVLNISSGIIIGD